jgi:Xaa-Pro aminopeptidase
MKTDLDSLMQANQLDAILITGPGQHNPAMVYLTGGGHLTNADLIKVRGKDAVLFYNPMERDEAARTGLATKNIAEFKLNELQKEVGGDLVRAIARRYTLMLRDVGITSGRVALYGRDEVGINFAIFSALQEELPGLTLVGETSNSVLMQAMSTKDVSEIERIRRMGQITTAVVAETAEFLTSHAVKDEILLKADGQPLTIGEVKQRINLWLAERGADNPEGTIFAIGRDAAVPHSTGTASDQLRLGQTIVYDIFPCEAGGGYYYDFTRTWCLGYAPDPVQALYQDVLDVYQQVSAAMKLGTHCPTYQDLACELFEAKGHPTIKSDPTIQSGYVHSLGHGLGLNIHERPWFGTNADNTDRIVPGAVFTIEPGLYYPDRGMGIRLENSAWVRPDGQIEVLADYPFDLVLPMHA